MTFVPDFQYFSGRKSRRSLPNQWPSTSTAGSVLILMAFSTACGLVMPRVKRTENGMPTPTVEPSSGVKLPTKVFFGVSVVKLESSAASRPSESLATACTVYLVAAARWVDGVQEAPPPVMVPSISAPLASLTVTSVSLPLATFTLRAPLVSTPAAPDLGEMVTEAVDCLPCWVPGSLLLPCPEPDPESPPPHAVRDTSRAPAMSASPLRLLPFMADVPLPRPPTDAPDIGRTFKLFSPRRARSGPLPTTLVCAC